MEPTSHDKSGRSRRRLPRALFAMLCLTYQLSGDTDPSHIHIANRPVASTASFEDTPLNTGIEETSPSPRPTDLDEDVAKRCERGRPVSFNSTDFDISAPIQEVGTDDNGTPGYPDDDRMAEPDYDKLGVFWDGMGGESKVRVEPRKSLIHSTQFKPSLVNRAMLNWLITVKRDSGEPIGLSLIMADGTKCDYEVAPGDIYKIENKKDEYPAIFKRLISEELSSRDLTITTCDGEYNYKTGTSNDAVLLAARYVDGQLVSEKDE